MENNGLRKKVFSMLLVYIVALASIACASFAMTISYVEEKLVTDMLLKQAKYLKEGYATNPNIQPISNRYSLIYEVENLPAEIRTFAKGKQKQTPTRGEKYQYFHFFIAIDKEAYLLFDIENTSVFDLFSTELMVAVAIFMLILIGLSLILTLAISSITVTPIIAISKSIKASKTNIPELPSSLMNRNDELGYLAKNLTSSYQDLASAMAREAEFTRDVSHELRTPISVMLNSINLNPDNVLSDASQSLLKEQLLLMNRRVTILLALARAESVVIEQVSLISVVEEAILSVHQLIEKEQFNIELEIPSNIRVLANKHLLQLLLSNLIENAIKYSNDGHMSFKANETALTVKNNTNVIVTPELMNKHEKSSRSDSLGQGLFLVSRILDSINWRHQISTSAVEFKLILFFTK